MIDKNHLRILFVEDLVSDVDLAVLELLKEGLRFEHKRTDSSDEFIKALKEFKPDIVISDYMMPSYNGMQALIDTREFDPLLPFIMFTGSMNEETAVECIKAGANDYVIKERLTRLPFAVKEVLEKHRSQIEKKAAEFLAKENQNKLQIIFRLAPVGIGLVVDQVFREVNDTFCKMTCYNRRELLGKNVKMIYSTNKGYKNVGIVKYWQNPEKGTGSTEARFKCKDGRILDIVLDATPLDKNDPAKGVIFTALDITERKQREKELWASEEKSRSIMENSADAIFISDPRGKYVYTNKAVTDMLGFASEEMKRKTINDIIPQNKKDEYLEIFEKVLSQGKAYAEVELLKKDGNFISADLNSVLLPGGLVYASCRDITERKRTQKELLDHRDRLEELVKERTEELSNAKKEAEEANRAKSEFLANMSHEIRTPLNAILGYTDLLNSLLVEKIQKDYLNSIYLSGRSLLKLINDILDLAKIEAGKLELEYDYVEAYSFFSEFERIFSLKVLEKGLKFILDISSGTPSGLYIDEARVRQIIFNILGNAVKFTSEGSIILKVFVENPRVVTSSKDKVEELIDLVIEVSDTGIGISNKIKDLIFEPFTQVGSLEKTGGTGLGLSITKKLLSLMNGSISVRSKPCRGSTFTLRIPAIAYRKDYAIPKSDILIDPSEIIFEEASILVVDDVKYNRSYIIDALRNTHLKIIEAEDGATALKMAKEIVPDLIIVDIRLPKMDGYQLLSKIKSVKKLKQIPVLAYSASVLKTQKERINKSDFSGLLTKPANVTELYLTLMNILPYKSLKKDESELLVSEPDMIDEIINLPDMVNALETDYYEIWKPFSIRQPISEIHDFADKLVLLGLNHNSGMITGYGKELISAAESFNIDALLKLIKKYKVLVENLRNSVKT